MIETAVEVSGGRVSGTAVGQLLDLGRRMLAHPVDLLEGAAHAVERLGERHRLVLITKGDLIHQEQKIARSGLVEHFERIEVVSEKDEATYAAILRRMEVGPAHFLMVGNSVRSDVLPVLAVGGHAVQVPYEITWSHEQVEGRAGDFSVLDSLGALADWLGPG